MKKVLLSFMFMGACFSAFCQQRDTAENHAGFIYTPPAARHHPVRGMYVAGGGDGSILSFATVKADGKRVTNLPRFSLFFNIGSSVNYDFSNNAGVFSGLNLKNIGFITRKNDIKIKRRLYTLGIPIGLKSGNFNNDFFFYFGGQYEMAINYKEKRFRGGKKVMKFNEWFSDRTPLLIPSLFAGIKMHNFNVKVQYYPNNFFDPAYTQTGGGIIFMPYLDMKANMFFVSFGYSLKIKKG